MKFRQTLLSLGVAAGLAMVAGNVQAGVLVHLFQWKFNDVANECEKVLGPKGFEGVQITPPAEHLNKPDVWWSVYQPINLGNFHSYGGTEEELRSMITRCKAVGVKIYADAVFNQFASGSGVGTGMSGYNAGSYQYPKLGYNDFHHSGDITGYTDSNNVWNGALYGMPDLNTGSSYVQDFVATYMKTLLSWGVAGFRVDAAKHMSPSDVKAILDKAGNPVSYLEVIGAPNESADIQPDKYTYISTVTEFGYGTKVSSNFHGQIKNLKTLGSSWGLLPSDKAFVFIVNHDRERGHGGGGMMNFMEGARYELGNVFMLAWPYGWKQVMSGYHFKDMSKYETDKGAPSSTPCSDNQWNCEQRRPMIGNMVLFNNFTEGQQVTNWWDNGNNQIAFGRGNKGFVVINNEGGSINQSLPTGLPAGEYCNLLAGDAYCSGSYVTVDSSGKASFNVGGMQAAAIIVGCTKSDQGNCKGDIPPAKTMFLRGTNNSWATTPMTYDQSSDSWSLTLQFTGEGDAKGGQRFKFDVAGDWKEFYGDDNADGIADKSATKDILFDKKGKYTVTLFNGDKHYTITPYVVPPMECKFKSMNFRGTSNGWKSTAMTLNNDTCTWSTVVDFTGQGDGGGAQRFKFDVYGNWTLNYGDSNGDGIADGGNAKDITFTGIGKYRVSLVEDGMGYTIKPVVTPQPPKAVISPETITVHVGDKLVLDASGSTDDQGITEYSWSTGGSGKTETVSFEQEGTEKVSVTVRDADGLESTATATVKVEPIVIPDPQHNLAKLYYRGTSNSWAPQEMELVDDYTWQTTVTLTGAKGERFKLDASDDMSNTYGDKDDDGALDQRTVVYPGYKGVFTLTVNDQKMSYSLEKQGDAYTSRFASFHVAIADATSSWKVLPMKLVSNNIWYARVKLGGKASQRLRFDVAGNGNKGDLWGDSDKNGVAEKGGATIAKSGKGYYLIKLNDKTMRYSIVAQ